MKRMRTEHAEIYITVFTYIKYNAVQKKNVFEN